MFTNKEQDAVRAAPDGLLPSAASDATTLINLFQDKTISPHELTALVGAHTSSKQFTTSTNPRDLAKPQDSTPGVWDVAFYNETVQTTPNPKIFRFASDIVLSKDSRTGDEWNSFIGNQNHWNGDYATAYVRLSLLGVNVINQLTECTLTLPPAVTSFKGSSETIVDQRLRRREVSRNVARDEASGEQKFGCLR